MLGVTWQAPSVLCSQEDEEEVRGKLFESKADVQKAKQAKRNKNAAYNIGKDLAGINAASKVLTAALLAQ